MAVRLLPARSNKPVDRYIRGTLTIRPRPLTTYHAPKHQTCLDNNPQREIIRPRTGRQPGGRWADLISTETHDDRDAAHRSKLAINQAAISRPTVLGLALADRHRWSSQLQAGQVNHLALGRVSRGPH